MVEACHNCSIPCSCHVLLPTPPTCHVSRRVSFHLLQQQPTADTNQAGYLGMSSYDHLEGRERQQQHRGVGKRGGERGTAERGGGRGGSGQKAATHSRREPRRVPRNELIQQPVCVCVGGGGGRGGGGGGRGVCVSWGLVGRCGGGGIGGVTQTGCWRELEEATATHSRHERSSVSRDELDGPPACMRWRTRHKHSPPPPPTRCHSMN
mgnify:CR=1 FL=1